MEVVFISDTHTRHKLFTPYLQEGGDMIVCCGDVTGIGVEEELRKFAAWYTALPFAFKIMVAGNHDFVLEQAPSLAKRILHDAGIIYLENSEVLINGFKFYGSPVTTNFNNWAFNINSDDAIKACWDKIPADTNILITHGPPLGILDRSSQGLHVGCSFLSDAVRHIGPAIHAFGHIHESYGTIKQNGTQYINAALLNEQYQPVHKPIRVNI